MSRQCELPTTYSVVMQLCVNYNSSSCTTFSVVMESCVNYNSSSYTTFSVCIYRCISCHIHEE